MNPGLRHATRRRKEYSGNRRRWRRPPHLRLPLPPCRSRCGALLFHFLTIDGVARHVVRMGMDDREDERLADIVFRLAELRRRTEELEAGVHRAKVDVAIAERRV